MLNTIYQQITKKTDLMLLGGLIFLSFFSFLFFSSLDLVTTYNDSMSHLNLTRLIIDNREPGISQLGGVWLPLNHILPLIFIWNDAAWQSGFAGSSFSMLAYIFSAVLIYKILMLLTGNKLASIVGSAAFALNLNNLYLQSTPLTESLYVGFFTASLFFSLKWIMTQNEKFLPIIGFFGFLQVLTRYDGWFVTFLQFLVLFSFDYVYNRKSFTESFSKMFLVCVPIAFGVGIWLLWNLLIFGSAFYFAFGPYSAHAQQEVISQSSGLITEGDLFTSIRAYYFTVIHNVGYFVMALAIFGSLCFLFLKNNVKSLGIKFLIFILFLSPFIFNVLALYLGFSILNIPELNWNPNGSPSGLWFNVRYGILALPAVAILLGILAARQKAFSYLITLVVVMQMFFTFNDGIITIVDGTVGASAYKKHDVSDNLRGRIGEDETVLLSIGFNNPIAFKIGVPLKNVIHEGVSKQWAYALHEPEKYADWIIVSNTQNGDPLYDAFLKNKNERLLANYAVEFVGNEATVYKRKAGLFSSAAGGGIQ